MLRLQRRQGQTTGLGPTDSLVCTDVWVNEDGTIDRRTRQAHRLIRVLGLDDREYTEFRLMWIEIVELAAREDVELHRKLMGLPGDLPNIARLRRPAATADRKGSNNRTLYESRKGFCRKHIDLMQFLCLAAIFPWPVSYTPSACFTCLAGCRRGFAASFPCPAIPAH